MRNGFRVWLPLFAALLAPIASGCRNCDAVENELRARDVQYREALDELMHSEATIEGLRRENAALRAGSKLPADQAASVYGVKKVIIGRGTGGLDNDRLPGDEGLQVWVEPRDASDHTIKAPGTLQVAVQEINAQGQKTLLSTWDIDAERLRKSWKQGLLSIGYLVELPWKTPPRVENLRVYIRWTLPDGRIFEDDRDVKVRLLPGASLRTETPASDTPNFKATPTSDSGPSIQQTGAWAPVGGRAPTPPSGNNNWQPQPLRESLNVGRPIPLEQSQPSGELFIRPVLGEIRVDD